MKRKPLLPLIDEPTISLPPGIDFRRPGQPEPGEPQGLLLGTGNNELLGTLGAQGLGFLGGLQAASQQAASGSAAHQLGQALDRQFRP